MSNQFMREYPGALATLELVDREGALEDLRQAILHERSRVIYITGEGGMGKTFLLREVLRKCREGGEWFSVNPKMIAATDVVDLYHTHTHSVEGLTRAFQEVLKEALDPDADLADYEDKMARFDRGKRDLVGMLRELSIMRDEVARAFLNGLNSLSENHRLVLALDTTEKLLYETDRVQRVLGLAPEGIAVLPWLLKEFLPKLRNAVVLLAGRPKPERLREDLRDALSDRLLEIKLGGFPRKEDASEYFDAVARLSKQKGRGDIADRIAAVPEDTREVIWLYTGGRPILLSLMVDYLLVSNQLLPEVKTPVEEARRKSESELRDIQARIEAELVRTIQDTGGLADEAIRALAWARKGLDLEMLALVADMNEDEAKQTLKELYDLSFIKVRPAEIRSPGTRPPGISRRDRFFLHDEMYGMFDRHVLKKLPRQRRETVYEAILAYYERALEEAREEVERLQEPRSAGPGQVEDRMAGGDPSPPADPMALATASARLYSLMVEEVYYRLRLDPANGFKAYHTYTQEAFWINDDTLDLQLRSEMLQYLAEHEDWEQSDGLRRSDVELAMGIEWGDRFLRRTMNAEALKVAKGLRERCDDLFEERGRIGRAELDSLEGRALAYSGQGLDRGENLLKHAIGEFQAFVPKSPFELWRRDVALADACNTLGYLYRTEGRYEESISAYEEAIPVWRRLAEREKSATMKRALRAQHANTLNNLAWALTWAGRFERAERMCADALGMRRELGPRVPLAFSLNTTGLIQIKNDQPDRARVNCERALAIFRDLQLPRGMGLGRTALAEAHRRMGSFTWDLYPAADRIKHLSLAQEHAAEAVDIFAEMVPEKPQLIQALVEQGCTYRDWAWVLGRDPTAHQQRETLASRGRDALLRAIREGEDEPGLMHMVVDAQVNLAWLHHYMHEDRATEEQIDGAKKRIPPDYYIDLERGLPNRKLPQSFLWVQLGKMSLLQGEIVRRRYHESKKLELLEETARYYTLSLAYDELFADDFRDMRRAKDLMYDRLKTLSEEEFRAIHRGIDDAAEKFHLEKPQKPARMRTFLEKQFGPLPG